MVIGHFDDILTSMDSTAGHISVTEHITQCGKLIFGCNIMHIQEERCKYINELINSYLFGNESGIATMGWVGWGDNSYFRQYAPKKRQ